MAQRLTAGAPSGLFPGLPGINPVAAAAAAGLALFNNPSFPGSGSGAPPPPSFLPPPPHAMPPGLSPNYPPGPPSAAAIHALIASRVHGSSSQNSIENVPRNLSPVHGGTTPSGSPLSSPLSNTGTASVSNHSTPNQLLTTGGSSSFTSQTTAPPNGALTQAWCRVGSPTPNTITVHGLHWLTAASTMPEVKEAQMVPHLKSRGPLDF